MSAGTCFVPDCVESARSWGTCHAHRIEELRAALAFETLEFSAEEYDRRRRQDQQLVRHVDALVYAPTATPDLERRAYSWPDITLTAEEQEVRAEALADSEWSRRMAEIEVRGSTVAPPAPSRSPVVARSSWETGGSPYGLAVLNRAADDIRALRPGGRNMEIARIAYRVGGFVGGAELDRVVATQEVVSAARDVGGVDAAQMVDTARRALAAGEERPLNAPERQPLHMSRPTRGLRRMPSPAGRAR